MDNATLFNYVMAHIWDPDRDNDVIAHAVASHVKTHRINAENAFEVLRVLQWNGAMKLDVREGDDFEPAYCWYRVTFPDDSVALVGGRNGIGDAVELSDEAPSIADATKAMAELLLAAYRDACGPLNDLTPGIAMGCARAAYRDGIDPKAWEQAALKSFAADLDLPPDTFDGEG